MLSKLHSVNEHLNIPSDHLQCFVTDKKEAVTLLSVHSLVKVSVFTYMAQLANNDATVRLFLERVMQTKCCK